MMTSFMTHPQTFLKTKYGSQSETIEKNKLKHVRYLVALIGQKGVLELQNGARTNSQVQLQYEINLHNQTKKTIRAS
jgi:hypothetical protein